ncbi:MAG: tRNA (adenosine(37)-N6)-dimethylallyltransferase MiaA [Flavobacteriales bacterium]|nr:tRNA (adenosine(37)-N6)-dimethylallyltransferase MiaA [Flavobacteriales bacterium]
MNPLRGHIQPRGDAPLLISIVGPTAVGKTGLSIALAKALSAEIVSADSRQFYRGIPIGTAQPTADERAEAPHHFVDFLALDEEYSAGRFASEAVAWLKGHFESRAAQGLPKVAIMVGGSGLYTQAVQEGFDDIPADPAVRAALNAQHASEGLLPLLEELQKLDPEHRKTVDPSNPHRVIRAVEVCRISGQTYTALRKQHAARRQCNAGGWTRSAGRPWDTLTIGLGAPRGFLHNRINERALHMVEAGWLEEARQVAHMRHVNALRTVGYPPLFDVLEGSMDMDTAVRRIQETTRQFARRQLTWFHRQAGVHWVDARQPERAVALVQNFMRHGSI